MKKFYSKFGLLGVLLLISTVVMAAKIGENILRIGDKTGSDVEIQMGSGRVKWSDTDSKMQFSNDGVSFKDIGSGSGAGGGENFNNGFGPDDNNNAEDGTTGWTSSGGVFAVTTVDPLEGLASFEYTPSAQNDYVENNNLSYDKDIFKGRACQAQIEYIGGDENLTAKVMDGNNDTLGSLVLPAHSISASESVFFICPSAADILGDANKGNLRIRIENVGASAAPLIKFDKAYNGTLIGLSETTLPDEVRVGVDCSGSSAVDQDAGVGIILSNISAGVCSMDYSSLGLTVPPRVMVTDATGAGAPVIVDSYMSTSTTVNIRCKTPAGATCGGFLASVSIKKAGADAKQSVQVYKSIPKVAENENQFTARARVADGSILGSNISGWISCVTAGTGAISCDLSGAGFTTTPSCVCGSKQGGFNDASCTSQAFSATSWAFRNSVNSLATAADIDIFCSAQGSDYKSPTVQPVIVGQVVNSYAESASKNVRVESCFVVNSGTPSTNNTLCDNWIGSLVDNGTGDTTVNFITGTFSSTPVCNVTPGDTSPGASNRGVTISSISTTSVRVVTFLTSTDSVSNRPFSITCSGGK